MKTLKHILVITLFAFIATACNDGIDDITKVDPGEDQSAPVVNIIYPAEGTAIKVQEIITSIDIEFEVKDDIEIGSISLLMDGTEIANFSEFLDYRRAVQKFTYDTLDSGEHILTVIAIDLEGKQTTASVNFIKEPPYTHMFAGETFYMPFDGDYMDLVGITPANKVGMPSFLGEGFVGTNAYVGATDAYLTFPTTGLTGTSFSAAFWYKVNASPDRAGILVVGDNADDRNQGFRLFREGNFEEQRLKLNVGTGDTDSWNDGGVIDVAAEEWVHVVLTISDTKSKIYLDGVEVNSADLSGPMDWTGCENFTIGSGGETFSYWDHKSDGSAIDELRFFNTELSPDEIQNMISTFKPYEASYEGETFYMSFDGNNTELNTNIEATVVGSPGFAGESQRGSDAFVAGADSYLTFPTEGLLSEELTASFWYKVNADPDRSGILVIGAPDDNNPDNMNNRSKGFRFFREGNATSQTFKLNVGFGDADGWFDGGAAATLDPTTAGWVHMAFTIKAGEAVVYINGEVVSQGEVDGVDWTGCDILSIGSGAPRFTEWGHLSDNSYLDELRLFNKALSQEEIQTIMDNES